MRLICPGCSAAYNLPDEKIPPRRAVAHCRRCGAEILVDPVPAAPGPGPENAASLRQAPPVPGERPEGVSFVPPSRPADFSIGEALQAGWKAAKGHLAFSFFFILLAVSIPRVPGIAQGLLREDHPAASAVLFVVSMGLHVLTSMGLLKTALNLYDGKPHAMRDLFSCGPLFLNYFYASLLYGLMLAAGSLLLVLPGIYLACRNLLYAFAIVDRGLSPVESLKMSFAWTRGHVLKLIGFSLALLGINLLGAIPLLLGLVVTLPTSLAASAHVYRKLSGGPPQA
ncbi:MAG: zinc-ribbon domain-containing protein [Desulfobacteraceae bacterium]|nr:zinc-ribbon domain-containing protein [Desulfobacteraceae bacterium]